MAPQALFLMNSPLVLEAAKAMAETVLAGCGAADEPSDLERAYLADRRTVRRVGRGRAALTLVSRAGLDGVRVATAGGLGGRRDASAESCMGRTGSRAVPVPD